MDAQPTAFLSAARRLLLASQRIVLALGALLCGVYALALTAGELGRRHDVASFSNNVAGFSRADPVHTSPDQSLWSRTRVQAFLASQGMAAGEPIGVLRARSLKLVAPLYPDSSELHLNRGAGLIEGMSQPDEGGNVGVAGHRDGFFRVLKDIRRGDILEVQTRARLHRYRVESISVVDAADHRLLADTEEPTITLVTCYPFYYLGHAPRRFVVRGAYLWPANGAPAT
ncbi:MAG TPA: class D sortase [Steroidobacter sp.]|jgi:LPXTG-site transpeptidase (sortase) family protein|nr:class D sortase [Steroidobacter sp.]